MYGSTRYVDSYSSCVSTASAHSFGNEDPSTFESRRKEWSSSQKGLIIVKAVVVLGILFVANFAIQTRESSHAMIQGKFSTRIQTSMHLRLYNSIYPNDPDLTAASYPFLEVGLLAEPQRKTTIEITMKDVSHGNCSYDIKLEVGGGPWDDIPNVVTARDFTATGNLSRSDEPGVMLGVVKFPSPGKYSSIIVCESFDGPYGPVESTLSSDIMVYYIRRELRTISDHDRKAFLHCFKTMMSVDSETGQKLYGRHFHPLDTFEIMHLDNAGTRNVDHFHDGMGLATQHMAMSAAFELSMQSILPWVALPYWDYTLDQHYYRIQSDLDGVGDEESSIFRTSKLFTAKWFGNTDSESHIVTEGPFAYQEVPRNYNYSVHSPYGFLRAPWNINPNKYVTRYHKICGEKVDRVVDGEPSALQWPTCASHFEYTNTDDEASWIDWSLYIGYLPHGPVHSWIGGVGGQCETAWDELVERGLITMDHLRNLKFYSFLMLKNMWRYGVINTPKYCSRDASPSQCMWKCSTNHSVFNDEYVSEFFSEYIGLNEGPNSTTVINRVLCETPFWPGDQLEAASPVDISFWPIHPTIERLLQYRSLIRPFITVGWPTKKNATCFTSTSKCKGHNPEDLTYFKTVYFDISNQTYVTSSLTNEEIRVASIPNNSYALSYVYDNFRWEHCNGTIRYGKTISFKEVDENSKATTLSALG